MASDPEELYTLGFPTLQTRTWSSDPLVRVTCEALRLALEEDSRIGVAFKEGKRIDSLAAAGELVEVAMDAVRSLSMRCRCAAASIGILEFAQGTEEIKVYGGIANPDPPSTTRRAVRSDEWSLRWIRACVSAFPKAVDLPERLRDLAQRVVDETIDEKEVVVGIRAVLDYARNVSPQALDVDADGHLTLGGKLLQFLHTRSPRRPRNLSDSNEEGRLMLRLAAGKPLKGLGGVCVSRVKAALRGAKSAVILEGKWPELRLKPELVLTDKAQEFARRLSS